MKFRSSIAHKRCIIQQRNHHSQKLAKYISMGICQQEHEMPKTRVGSQSMLDCRQTYKERPPSPCNLPSMWSGWWNNWPSAGLMRFLTPILVHQPASLRLGLPLSWMTCVLKKGGPMQVTVAGQVKKGLNSIITLGAWSLWIHCNHCVFDGGTPSSTTIISTFKDEGRQWALAGTRGISHLLALPLLHLSLVKYSLVMY